MDVKTACIINIDTFYIIEELEKITKRKKEKKEYDALFQDISERIEKLKEFVTGDTIILFLGEMIQKCVIREN